MAKKLNSMPDYQARMPRTGHDLSQSTAFTCSTGMLLPVYHDMLHPGDHLHFDAGLFARLNPLTVGFLGEIDVHIDYFFVPLSVMYTPVTSMFYQTDDLFSSAIDRDQLIKDAFPALDINSFFLNSNTTYSPSGNQPAGTWADGYSSNRFDCAGKSYYRILELLGYNPKTVFGNASVNVGTQNPVVTPWFLAAYQACYQDFYRNDDRERRNYHYNFDKYYNVSTFPVQENNGEGDVPASKPLFALNYASRPKDYFNSVKVSPLFSAVGTLGGDPAHPDNGGNGISVSDFASTILTKINSSLLNSSRGSFLSFRPNTPSSQLSSGTETTVNVDMGDYTDVSSVFASPSSVTYSPMSASAIRQLFMADKMLRVFGRAKKTYESQFLAHYGIKIPHDVLHNITHIGHDMKTFGGSPVLSTADTYNSSTGDGAGLGEVGGQGQVSFRGKRRNFRAPCHGVFLAILHFMPRYRYISGVEKLLDLSDPMKFWQPEYDRKGMQPLYQYEASFGIFQPNSSLATNSRVGWQFGYEQFKRKVNRATSVFLSPDSSTQGKVNTYAPWVLATTPYSGFTSGSAQLSNFSVASFNFSALLGSPCDLNGVLQVPYVTQWSSQYSVDAPWLLFQTDPFICDFNMNCGKVNFMSEYSEPELN